MKFLSFLFLLLLAQNAFAFFDEEKESAYLFPSVYSQNADGTYKQTIHFWLMEEDFDKFKQNIITDIVTPVLEENSRTSSRAEKARFLKRAKWFAFEPVERSTHAVLLPDTRRTMITTSNLGHARINVLHTEPIAESTPSNITIEMTDGNAQTFSFEPITIKYNGLSVISDIDDTLKVSNVISKKQLIRSTFIDRYRVIPGMPGLLREYENAGAHFHYVSASPWQLWPSLEPFMAMYYPKGQVHLRDFPTDIFEKDFYKFLFGPSRAYKRSSIEKLLTQYPGHKFILIGDTGECDPEIYGEITRKYGSRIEGIILNKVPKTNFSESRLKAAFSEKNIQKLKLVGEDAVPGEHVCSQ